MGQLPVARCSTHSKTCNKIFQGPQMAVCLLQQELLNSSHSRDVVKRKLGCNDVVSEQHSNSNIENENELVMSSVDVPEQSTMLYPLTMVLKALDKWAHHIDDEQDAEMQEAPPPSKKDCTGTTQP